MLILKNGKLIRKKDNKLNESDNESVTNKLNSIISKAKSKQDFWNFVNNVWNKMNDKDAVDETPGNESGQTQNTVTAISPAEVVSKSQQQLFKK